MSKFPKFERETLNLGLVITFNVGVDTERNIDKFHAIYGAHTIIVKVA